MPFILFQNKISELTKDRLLKDSLLVFLAGGMVSFVNMLYQILMARNLSLTDFAVFTSLLSILMVMAVPAAGIRTMVLKFVSSFDGSGKKREIKPFFFMISKRVLIFGILLLLMVIIGKSQIANYLKIKSGNLLYFLVILIIFQMITPIGLSTIQGLRKFKLYSFLLIASSLIKLLSGLILVIMGYRVAGALGGFIIASIIVWLYILIYIFGSKKKENNSYSHSGKVNPISAYRYLLPTTLAYLCFALLTNADIIFVKHFFTPTEAGYYCIGSLVGKIVLFLPAALIKVSFPEASYLASKGSETRKVLKKTLTYAGAITTVALLACLLFPGPIVRMLNPNVIPQVYSLARLFAISFTFFAIINIMMHYMLSISHLKFIFPLLLITMLHILLLFFFHAKLEQVLFVMIFSSSILFLINLFFGFMKGRENVAS